MDSSAPTLEPVRAITSAEAAHTLFASFLGWALDAFDFFILIFVMPAVAREFHRPISHIAFTITATLALRPVGALIFGWIADRYRPPHPTDDRRHLLFPRRSAERPRAELRMVPGDARAVRNRDGRRMGRGRVARDGSGRAALARILFRTSAGGLCGRLPARGGRVLLRLPAFRMARDVLSRRRARAADDLHPHQGARVGSMAAHAPRHSEDRRGNSRQLEIVPLPVRTDDNDEFRLARHPGHVPDLPRKDPRLRHPHRRDHRDHLQCRRAARRPDLRLFFRSMGTSPHDGDRR